jgi:hypothetical protein
MFLKSMHKNNTESYLKLCSCSTGQEMPQFHEARKLIIVWT